MRRFLVLLLFVLAPLPVAASPAYACSCKAGVGLDQAQLAFVGVVNSVDESGGSNRVAFGIESVIKGTAPDTVTLTTSDNEAACGYRFFEGARYRVLSTGGETSLCSGNEMLTATPAYTAQVQKVSESRATTFWAGLGVVLLVVAAGITWVIRQPRSR